MPRRGALSLALMKASVRWLGKLIGDPTLTAEAAEAALTDAGFPIDARDVVNDGDIRLEVEVTSNRGDCLSHIGLAREMAARGGSWRLELPEPPKVKRGEPVTDALRLQNSVPDLCPRFTAHVVRGIKVGPSPAWLSRALESVGQRSINNVVDVTNYINFLYGQPTHAFDLAKLAGKMLVVRMAREGEVLTTLDGKKRTLRADEVVVADERAAQSLAGVIGGADSEVGPDTRDVVLEAATWDPVAVRRAARRHQVRTDASHRFERGVDARTIDDPALLAAAMIADLGGGTLCAGMLDAGRPVAPRRTISLRTDRCRGLMGVPITDEAITAVLRRLSIDGAPEAAGVLRCTVPAFRLDLEREVDLIEEVARVHGLDRVPLQETIRVAVRPPQASESAMQLLGHTLAGLGFYETVTFSFVTEKQAKPFLPPGQDLVAVHGDRRAADGTLRPSVIPSLLACRRANDDASVTVSGGIRLYEAAAVFGQRAGASTERRTLALVLDVPGVERGRPGSPEQRQLGVRLLRGALEAAARTLGGEGRLTVRPERPTTPAFEDIAHGLVMLDGTPAGSLGLISPETLRLFGLEFPVAAAEVDLAALVRGYPARAKVGNLPAFPSIDRDLSLIVDEAVTWDSIHRAVIEGGVDRLESVAFIGTYRGKQAGAGKKSVTLRMRFRDPARTLRREEVDPQVAAVVELTGRAVGATLRV